MVIGNDDGGRDKHPAEDEKMMMNGKENTGPAKPAREVDRVTALRGHSIFRPRERKSSLRRRTRALIFEKDAEVPYVKLEAALQDLVCSLMERQDRMNEEIFRKVVDLEYRLNDLEYDRRSLKGGR